jgi:hypothetical protein
MVELVSLLFVNPVDCRDELAITVPLVVLLTLHSLVVVLGLIRGFNLRLTLVLLEYCADGLLTGGVACCEVEQLPCSPWFATSDLVDECFISHARDERSNHVRIHDIRQLVALLGKATNVLA